MNTSEHLCFAVYCDSIAKKIDFRDCIFREYDKIRLLAMNQDDPDAVLEQMWEAVDKRIAESEARVESLGLDEDPADALSFYFAMRMFGYHIARAQRLRSVARQDGTVFRCDMDPNFYSGSDTLMMVSPDGTELDVTSDCKSGVLCDIAETADWVIPFGKDRDMKIRFEPMPSERRFGMMSRTDGKGNYSTISKITGSGPLPRTLHSVLADDGKRVVAIYERRKEDDTGFHDIIAVLTPANDPSRYTLTKSYNIQNGSFSNPQYNLTGEQIKNRIRGMERIVYNPQFDPDGMIGVL